MIGSRLLSRVRRHYEAPHSLVIAVQFASGVGAGRRPPRLRFGYGLTRRRVRRATGGKWGWRATPATTDCGSRPFRRNLPEPPDEVPYMPHYTEFTLLC